MPGAALRGHGRAYLASGGAAWTRKEGQSPSGGLNAKGRASYTKGTLKAPTKSKTSGRRKSFCARMGGMPGAMMKDGKPTRKKLALDKWNC